MQFKFKFRIIYFVFIFFSIALISCSEKVIYPEPESKEVRLGAILDFSGNYSEEGLAAKAVIELALERLNQRYASIESPVRYTCTFADSKLDTSLTLAAAKDMNSQGIKLLVGGPNSSADLNAIKNYVNENQMVTLCCISSSPSLAIPNDYIFRLITDDNNQAQALLRMMQYNSIKVLIPIWRADTYGTGLYETLKQKFEFSGGTVLQGVSYQPGATNYQEIINSTGAQVNSAIAGYGAESVAVILITYQEGSAFLNAASNVPQLRTVKWFGCDANAQKSSITNDTLSAQFAAGVKFLAPIMGIGTASYLPINATEIATEVFNRSGLYPDAYALSAYDAVMITALAFDVVQSYNPSKIKVVLSDVCSAYNYMGISRRLNEAGDLASANYIFWTVDYAMGGYIWNSFATYIAEGEYIEIKN